MSASQELRKRNPQDPESGSKDDADALSNFKNELKNKRKEITLFRSPITTLTIFFGVLIKWILQGLLYIVQHRPLFYSLSITSILLLAGYSLDGPHSLYLVSLSTFVYFCVWWIGLGVLSSVGLGTGLHTFVLYLGPHIAKVTLAVTECGTLDVPLEGPNALVCPTNMPKDQVVSFFGILYKVAFASFLWGAGTALGELPPYFVSRAAKLSGQKLEELEELEEEEKGVKQPSAMDQVKLHIYHLLQRWGFWAIVVFASVPNPLFDLAGITCGHFLIPFWTFFGATFIGKAVIKVQIQAAFVILAFSKERLEWIIAQISYYIPSASAVLIPFFEKQRKQFHSTAGAVMEDVAKNNSNMLSTIWNSILIAMLLFFVKSIIESTVQEKLAERDAEKLEKFQNNDRKD